MLSLDTKAGNNTDTGPFPDQAEVISIRMNLFNFLCIRVQQIKLWNSL
jgi:hypothetical protein